MQQVSLLSGSSRKLETTKAVLLLNIQYLMLNLAARRKTNKHSINTNVKQHNSMILLPLIRKLFYICTNYLYDPKKNHLHWPWWMFDRWEVQLKYVITSVVSAVAETLVWAGLPVTCHPERPILFSSPFTTQTPNTAGSDWGKAARRRVAIRCSII